MIVRDTNVLSEIFRPSTETRVVDWLASLTGDVAITSVTRAELLSGVRKLPDGRCKTVLVKSIESVLGQYRGSCSVLPFDEVAAECYADVLAAREGAGALISTADAPIAAMRNTKDFEHTGIDLINPWRTGGDARRARGHRRVAFGDKADGCRSWRSTRNLAGAQVGNWQRTDCRPFSTNHCGLAPISVVRWSLHCSGSASGTRTCMRRCAIRNSC